MGFLHGTPSAPQHRKRVPTRAFSLVSCAIVGVWILRHTLIVVEVDGGSMEPALRSGDRVLVRRVWVHPRRGSIVVLRPPRTDGADTGHSTGVPWMVKRVVALARDAYPPVVVAAHPDLSGRRIAAGRVIVLGDNPLSLDSKAWGAIRVERIVGVVITRLRSGEPAARRNPRPVR